MQTTHEKINNNYKQIQQLQVVKIKKTTDFNFINSIISKLPKPT